MSDSHEPSRASRRDALKKLGLGTAGAAAAWSTPALLSVDAASAFTAQGIEFVSSSTNSAASIGGGSGTTQDVVVTAPAGLQEFDLLLAIVGTNGSSGVTTPGSAWTQQSQNTVTSGLTTNRAVVFSRVATASEPASFTFRRTFTGFVVTGGPFRVLIVAYRFTTGINAGGIANQANASSGTHTFPTATGRHFGWAIRLGLGGPGGAADWATPTAPAVQDADTGNVDRNLIAFHQVLGGPTPPALPGTVATATTTLGIVPNRPAITFTVAINSQFNP